MSVSRLPSRRRRGIYKRCGRRTDLGSGRYWWTRNRRDNRIQDPCVKFTGFISLSKSPNLEKISKRPDLPTRIYLLTGDTGVHGQGNEYEKEMGTMVRQAKEKGVEKFRLGRQRWVQGQHSHSSLLFRLPVSVEVPIPLCINIVWCKFS